jgi:hypothetical protein
MNTTDRNSFPRPATAKSLCANSHQAYDGLVSIEAICSSHPWRRKNHVSSLPEVSMRLSKCGLDSTSDENEPYSCPAAELQHVSTQSISALHALSSNSVEPETNQHTLHRDLAISPVRSQPSAVACGSVFDDPQAQSSCAPNSNNDGGVHRCVRCCPSSGGTRLYANRTICGLQRFMLPSQPLLTIDESREFGQNLQSEFTFPVNLVCSDSTAAREEPAQAGSSRSSPYQQAENRTVFDKVKADIILATGQRLVLASLRRSSRGTRAETMGDRHSRRVSGTSHRLLSPSSSPVSIRQLLDSALHTETPTSSLLASPTRPVRRLSNELDSPPDLEHLQDGLNR